ncbi:Lrp/AsnC family transcriptional regulator [Robertkochia marina]|uniref:Lrp/AsnC family transcriptional regulator n=1 Tax=Robertkochia marina TaxID=1227945 RepID=A0A4S3M3D1_9FLAO|nr:Lrp/AsnC family transcriptional regulator [Robertkochia marina]THD68005.1 Lrp/AsnC family transcriptional regulator [Robertkochia marina]TRZ42709.1 Lrp/AsnC family transcriptional regulator [Robertkochia marina]
MELDAIDRKLLISLQKDAKQTTKELALQMGLSNTAVYERVRKLEREGVIRQYTVMVDRQKVNKAFVVFCHIRLTQHTKENVSQFEKEVVTLSEVQECYHVSGDYDYILKIHVADMEDYRNFMLTKLTNLKHIGNTHSIFMIGEVKNSSVIEVGG